MRRTALKSVALAVAALAFAVPAAFAQSSYKPEYKLSTVVGPAFPWGKGGEIWADLVRERTKGRINIKLYPGASLVNGDQTREFTAVRQGAIDLAIGSTINWSPQIKEFNLFSMPFLAQDHAGLDALTQGEIGKEMFALVEKAGVVPLAWGENGFREVTNSKREIRKPEDMKGLKFRVVGSPIFNDTFTALGANPDADELGRRPAGARLGRGRRTGESAAHLHRGQAAQRRPEVRHDLGLPRRSADLRRQQGSLELVDAGGSRDRASRRPSTPASRRSRWRARGSPAPTTRCTRKSRRWASP